MREGRKRKRERKREKEKERENIKEIGLGFDIKQGKRYKYRQTQ